MNNLIKSLALVGVLTVVGAARTQALTASPNPVCGTGLNITLTANNQTPGTYYCYWNPSGVNFAYGLNLFTTTTAAAAGTYTVKIWSGAGCSGVNYVTETVTVTVNAIPAAPTAGNNGPICAGSTLNLTASTVSGATYAWTGPNGFTSTAQNPTISGATTAATGTYSVTATVNGCPSAPGTTSATVYASPSVPTAGNSGPVCAGSTLSLTASTVSGATYAWTGPGGFTSTAQNPTRPSATTAMTGTYSVTATVGGCTSAAGTTAATVKAMPAAPTAGNNGPICAGSTLSLTASTVTGATYAWTGPASFTSALQNPTRPSATTAMTGSYSVTATVNGCTSAAGTTAATVKAMPAAPTAGNNGPVCPGGTLNLTASTVSGATYAWTGPAGFASSAQNPTISGATPAATGTYSVTATVNGCTSAPGTTAATVNDAQPPSVTCPANVTVSANAGVCYATGVALGTPATGDNCGIQTVSNNAPAQFDKGVTTVIWTAVDTNGNTATCSQSVTVNDTEAPTISCPADVTVSANAGSTATNVALGSPVTSDNCSVALVASNAPAAYPLGTNGVIWTVTDGSGNTATCTQQVIVRDTTAPTLTVPTDVDITL